jgi:hypothetical protein
VSRAETSRELEDVAGATHIPLFERIEDVDTWDTLDLQMSLAGLDSAPAAELWLQVLCPETRLERATRIAAPPPDPVSCRVRLGDVRGDVLVRVLGVAREGAGTEAGLVVADSDGVLVRVDAPAEPFGSGLRTVWDKEYFAARGIGNALTCVEFPPSEEPCLYLNSGIQDFQGLLTSKATSGPIAATRQLLLDQIEVDTWLAIGRNAAQQMYRMDADTGDVVLEDPDLADAWQGVALGRIAANVGEGSGEDARASVAARLLDAEAHELLRCRLASAVSQKRGLAGRVTKLAHALGRINRDEG